MSSAKTVKKKIVVFSATGRQGQSVCRTLCADDAYEVFAVTRTPSSDSAEGLKALGAQVVHGDYDDPESYWDHLKSTHGVFLNTDWLGLAQLHKGDMFKVIQHETKQGFDVVNACREHGVKHIFLSNLVPSTDQPSIYKLGKHSVRDYLIDTKTPYTNFYGGAYFSNMVAYGWIKGTPNSPDGFVYDCGAPDEMSNVFFDAEGDTGSYVKLAFDKPEEWLNRTMSAKVHRMTCTEVAQVLSDVSGKPVRTEGRSVKEFMTPEHKSKIPLIWASWENIINHSLPFDRTDSTPPSGSLPEGHDMASWARENIALHEKLGF